MDLGVMVDLAHLNEKGFWEVAELSSNPLVSNPHRCLFPGPKIQEPD